MNRYALPWGKGEIAFDLPQEAEVFSIEAKASSPLENLGEKVRGALANPVGTPPLSRLVKAGEKVVIVTSDITRLAYRTDAYLPVIIDVLQEAGIKKEDITILMATGTHRAQTPAEHRLIVGEEVFGQVNIVDHDCRAEDLVYVGQTSFGTRVAVNSHIHQADKVILTGGLSYHMLAGFGGGRKSLVAGVCSYETVQQNHSLAIKDAGDLGINQLVGTGLLRDNPVALDMMEAAKMIGADFLVNVVVNENKEITSIVAGDMELAFLAGCRVVEETFGIPIAKQADLVIASCGGYPKDIQLYQSVKALDNAAYAVKEGGAIILFSECSDGVGSEDFIKWFDCPDVQGIRQGLGERFTMPGFVALRTASIISSSPVILISSLPGDLVRKTKMHPAATMAEALALAERLTGKPQSIALMPHGSLTFPICK